MDGQTRPPRRKLRDIELDRASKKLRTSSLNVLTVVAGANVIAWAIERHREDLRSFFGSRSDNPDWGPWHSLAAESYLVPIIVPALVLLAALWARRGFPRALAPGLLAVVAFFAMIWAWISNHLFDYTEGGVAAGFALIALTACGAWMIVIEIVLPIRCRRRLEGADPVFPTATALPPRDP
jgi:hypothetical protein